MPNLEERKRKLYILLGLDGLCSALTVIFIVLFLVDYYKTPTVLTGQVANTNIQDERVGKSFTKEYFLTLQDGDNAYHIQVNKKIANSVKRNEKVEISVTPTFNFWQKVKTFETNHLFVRHSNFLFWCIGLVASLLPIFMYERWSTLNWGYLLSGAMLVKVIFFCVIIAQIS